MKKVWFVLLVVSIIVISTTVTVAIQKPDDNDLMLWMEETYGIECLDYSCRTFRIFDEEEGSILFETDHENYSSGLFVMEVEREYRNYEGEFYYLDIKVKGSLGKFTIEEETVSGLNKK